MGWSLLALLTGFVMDLFLGDPSFLPHPVAGIGKLITFLENRLRPRFPATRRGERTAGMVLWLICVTVCFVLPLLILVICRLISPWLRYVAESIMCWQILAAKSLRTESMKVYDALKEHNLEKARYQVSMIVGRDTDNLDEKGIIRAAVETVAENTSDGVIAPLFFLALGGAPLGFLYKAANTMDSMLGYTDPPYTNFGFFPAKADDVLNFVPARISALLLLAGGWILNLWKNQTYLLRHGWYIFRRDRYQHKSPNSAQTESMVAGLLGVRLAGDAFYHGVLHQKPYIGDPLREITQEDIPASCNLMYAAAVLALLAALLHRGIWILF